MRISEPIQEIESQQTSNMMTIDPLLHYPGFHVDGISMMISIGGQQEMVIDNDGPERSKRAVDRPAVLTRPVGRSGGRWLGVRQHVAGHVSAPHPPAREQL